MIYVRISLNTMKAISFLYNLIFKSIKQLLLTIFSIKLMFGTAVDYLEFFLLINIDHNVV